MNEIIVAYWSQTGNTKMMAEEIGKGIEIEGKEAVVMEISKVSLEDLSKASVFALGCPSMGDEVLEECEMEPFVSEVEKFVSGKNIGLFGSYGWGDGQWMRDWTERMIAAGANVVNGEGLIAQDTPDTDALLQYKNLGIALAKL